MSCESHFILTFALSNNFQTLLKRKTFFSCLSWPSYMKREKFVGHPLSSEGLILDLSSPRHPSMLFQLVKKTKMPQFCSVADENVPTFVKKTSMKHLTLNFPSCNYRLIWYMVSFKRKKTTLFIISKRHWSSRGFSSRLNLSLSSRSRAFDLLRLALCAINSTVFT